MTDSARAHTENGFVRILNQPRYPSPVSPATAIELLDAARGGGRYAFWPCDVSVLDSGIVDRSRLHGPRLVIQGCRAVSGPRVAE